MSNLRVYRMKKGYEVRDENKEVFSSDSLMDCFRYIASNRGEEVEQYGKAKSTVTLFGEYDKPKSKEIQRERLEAVKRFKASSRQS